MRGVDFMWIQTEIDGLIVWSYLSAWTFTVPATTFAVLEIASVCSKCDQTQAQDYNDTD